ncbi:MAG: DUF72 domain-containing protein, partial [Bacteroidota bacterium]|nr:DUF72 domain-containing protein [Bacteroidota bacterium]
MDFGKVKHPEAINFMLPPASPETQHLLAKLTPVTYLKPKIYLGCPTWANKDWLGSYYPAGLPAKEYLHYYSQQFNTIELNTTHYRIPDEST